MVFFAKSQEEILKDVVRDLSSSTPLTKLTPGSIARTFSEAVSRNISGAYQTFDSNLIVSFLAGARGKYLDYLAEIVGISRLGTTGATVSASAKNVRFYVESGTFGSINGGASILVPAGTLIKTSTTTNAVLYRTTSIVLLPSAASEAFVAVESVIPGSKSNVGSGTLIYHTFVSYSDYANSSLKVINDASINSAREIESDTNFKYRLANALLSQAQANATAIRIAALNVVGVADVILSTRYRGIGTSDLLIQSTQPSVSTELINAVRAAVQGVGAEGMLITVRGPQEFGIALEASFSLREYKYQDAGAALKRSVSTALVAFLDSLAIGDELVLSDLINTILNTDRNIKTVGTSYTKPLDRIYVYKPTELQDNSIREELLSDFTPPTDGRIIVETTVSEPITLTII